MKAIGTTHNVAKEHNVKLFERSAVQMKKLGYLIVGLSVLLCGGGAVFGENEIEFEVTADFFSKYIWRGQKLNDDPVFQPGISATYGNLTAAIWGNLDLTNYNDRSGDFF